MWRDKGLRNILLFASLIGILLFAGIYSAQVLQDIPTAIVDLDRTGSSQELIEMMNNAENLEVVAYPSSFKEVETLIKQNKAVVGVVIPENFGRDLSLGRQTRVAIFIDGSNMAYATNASSAVLEVTRTISAKAGIKTLLAKGVHPDQAVNAYQAIEFKEESWFNPTLNYAYFLILGLALNIWQQCCTLAACMNVIGENGVKSWLQIRACGVSKFVLFFSKSLTHIITFMAMALPVFFLAFAVLKLPLACSFSTLLLFTLAFAVAMHSVGTLMSTLAVNAVDSTRFGMVVALPSFVLSGFTWPIEAMPEFLQHIVYILPQTWFFQGINYLSFKNPGWQFMSQYFLSFALIAVVCYGITALVVCWQER